MSSSACSSDLRRLALGLPLDAAIERRRPTAVAACTTPAATRREVRSPGPRSAAKSKSPRAAPAARRRARRAGPERSGPLPAAAIPTPAGSASGRPFPAGADAGLGQAGLDCRRVPIGKAGCSAPCVAAMVRAKGSTGGGSTPARGTDRRRFDRDSASQRRAATR